MLAIDRLSRSLISHRLVYLSLVRGTEVCLFVVAVLSAFLLRFEFSIPPQRTLDLAYALAVWVPIQALAYHSLGLWSGGWRFVSLHDAVRLLWANLAATLSSFLVILSNRSCGVSSVTLYSGFPGLLFARAWECGQAFEWHLSFRMCVRRLTVKEHSYMEQGQLA